MRLFRVSEEKAAPNWTFASASLDQYEKTDYIDADQVNLTDANDVDEKTLCNECSKIELCASNGEQYYCNASWKAEHVSHLKEYALACGLDAKLFKKADASGIEKISKTSAPQIKTASAKRQEITLETVWKDPFNIEKNSNTSHMDKANWEQVTKASVMGDAPKMSGINPIRGSENYQTNSDTPLAINQNSILNPEALDKLSDRNDAEFDNGIRLRQEAKSREVARAEAVVQWEKDKMSEMKYKNMLPEGKVFQTASAVANTGLKSKASQMANIDKNNIPELTSGEQLKTRQEERKASIQRPKGDETRSGDGRSEYLGISSDFAKSLKKKLG